MLTASEICSFPCLSGEARQAAMAALNAVAQWRDEIASANDRCLTKVLDQVATAQLAQGWPNSVTIATREHLAKAAKIQTQMLDRLMAEWEQQLKSKASSPNPAIFASAAAIDPVSEVMRFGQMTLTPYKIWFNAAEAWQRSWADTMRGSTAAPQIPRFKRAA